MKRTGGWLALFAAAVAPALVHAAAKPAVGARFLNVPLSVRQMAMGDVTVGDPDVLRAWSNPAYLGAIPARAQIGVNEGTGDRYIQQIVAAGGAAKLSESFALGGLLSYAGIDFNEVDASGTPGATVQRQSRALGLSGSWAMGMFRVGATLKGVSESSPQDAVALSGAAADLGGLFESGGFSAAASLRNVGTALHADDAELPGGVAMPTEIRAGLAYRWPRFLAGAEFVTSSGPGLGVTAWVSEAMGIRAGLARLGRPDQALTFGFSALVVDLGSLKNLGVDYSLQYQSPMSEHRVCLSVAFGGPPGDSPAK